MMASMERSVALSSSGVRQDTPSLDAAMANILREYDATKQAEERRHRFLENLMDHIKAVTSQRDNALRKLQGVERLNNAYQDDLSLANQKIDSLQKSMDCDRFVVAVVDGDNALFKDEYIRDGAAGGERAAHKLHQAIQDYLKDKPYFQLDFKIIVKVFVQLQGLCKTYMTTGLVSSLLQLLSFVQGFNKTHELVEIVDAGNLKEATDTKVKAQLSLYRRNLHCKHLLLAASGDNSYAGFLRQFISIDGASQQVTLIESLPFARDLAQLTEAFQITRFDEIFRPTKIVIDTTASNGARAPLAENSGNAWTRAATLNPSILPTRSAPSPVVGKANTVKNGILVPKPYKEILVNVYNERLDPYIKYDYDLYAKLKSRKMCNYFWLANACSGYNCPHDHSGSLTTTELEQLRLVARTLSCRAGLDCKNPDCIDGHKCLHGDKCKVDKCRFSNEMHHVSTEGRRTVAVEQMDDEYGTWVQVDRV